MLLELLRAAFPMSSSTIPSSFYEAKQKLRDLGLRYETIHACKYDCVYIVLEGVWRFATFSYMYQGLVQG